MLKGLYRLLQKYASNIGKYYIEVQTLKLSIQY